MLKTILIVDDDKNLTGSLARTLRKYKDRYKVIVTNRASSVQPMMDYIDVDLILTDIFMPQISGLTLIKEIRENSKDVKIIAMSGGRSMGAESKLQSSLDMGANLTLAKPFTEKQLTEALKLLLDI